MLAARRQLIMLLNGNLPKQETPLKLINSVS
jgi:hypothetical protein